MVGRSHGLDDSAGRGSQVGLDGTAGGGGAVDCGSTVGGAPCSPEGVGDAEDTLGSDLGAAIPDQIR
jgi:hypothetical protein